MKCDLCNKHILFVDSIGYLYNMRICPACKTRMITRAKIKAIESRKIERSRKYG